MDIVPPFPALSETGQLMPDSSERQMILACSSASRHTNMLQSDDTIRIREPRCLLPYIKEAALRLSIDWSGNYGILRGMSSALPSSSSSSNLRRIESAPLLGSKEPADRYLYGTVDNESIEEETQAQDKVVTPLPTKQVLLLSLMRMAAPLAYSQIFPYINEMVLDLGIVDDVSEVGYYSGLVDSVFSFVQLFTCLRIGMLGDQLGRKPVLVVGLYGIVVCTVLFGLSKSFIWTLATRSVAGALWGNTIIINSAVSDLTDDTNQAQAYAWIGLAYSIASVSGPVIGGTFAKPEVTWPNSLGKLALFREFPYLCPCAMTAFIAFIALVSCALFFKETRPAIAHRRPSLKQIESYHSSQDISSDVLSAKDLSAWQLALDPVLFSIFRSSFILNILNMSVSVIFSLFAYTPIQDGGLSRSPEEIGYAMALSGVLGGVAEVIFLAPLQRHFGALMLLQFMMALWPIIFLLFPVSHLLARSSLDHAPASGIHDLAHGVVEGVQLSRPLTSDAIVWIAISVLLVLQRLATMAYPVNLVLTRKVVPSDEVLGTVFGLSQLIGSCARTIAPTFISSLFAFSKEHNVLGGNFVWLVMIGVSSLGIWTSFMVYDNRDDAFNEEETLEEE